MEDSLLVGLASVVVFGITAQWMAWRFRLPSILLFLIFGFIAGPVTGWLDPDLLLGHLLIPVVSLSVGVILFEGGLTLYTRELRTVGTVIRNLVSVGALVTWIVTTTSAHYLVDLSWPISILLGAILVVTGPTVIGPLLRHIGPIGPVGSILKWEGIVIDPIGATLAVLVYEALLIGEFRAGAMAITVSVIKTILIGGGIGVLGALALIVPVRRHKIPEALDVPITLMVVVAVFALANELQSESGLLATTVMGMVLTNQQSFAVRHIVEFKENLRVLLLASLFVLLAARIPLEAFYDLQVESFLFLGALMFVARPLGVLVSTWGSDLSWKEKAFLAWMAPRGIVAAAVSSIFALELAEAGYPEAERIVPLTFLVILVTVIVYGLMSRPLAKRLGLSEGGSQGVLFLGAHGWARQIASALQGAGFPVLMVDNNRQNTTLAQMDHVPAYYGNVLSDYAQETMPLDGVDRLVALTKNEEVNSLASLRFADIFGRDKVYQLAVSQNGSKREGPVARPLRGRQAFGNHLTFDYFEDRFEEGAVIKATKLTEEFDYADLLQVYRNDIDPLFLITQGGGLHVYTANDRPTPQAGQTLIFMATPHERAREELSRAQATSEAATAYPRTSLPG